MEGLYDTWFALLSSLIVSAGIDLENPKPLHVFVGVLTSVTTGFFNIAENRDKSVNLSLSKDTDRIILKWCLLTAWAQQTANPKHLHLLESYPSLKQSTLPQDS